MFPLTILANKRLVQIPFLLYLFYFAAFVVGTSVPGTREERSLPGSGQHQFFLSEQKPLPANPKTPIFPDFLVALGVLQQEFYAIWQGVWPTSIDWTSAVLGTFFSGALTTLSSSYPYSSRKSPERENLINRYFSHLVGAYFGQDVFGLMQEAHDDMLWVVLEWLEGIKFITYHSARHYANPLPRKQDQMVWHGTQYIPAFAHRARIFWELASKGWDSTLCGGGMLWNSYPPPYKNAITNELYIAASISMYLYFPGDDNSSPFNFNATGSLENGPPGKPHDPKYLAEAIKAYKWLQGIHMTNDQGLYADGFHISGWTGTNNTRTVCDQRDEMVYTYNQGVLLSGLRGLYEATGSRAYLEDGHKLVKDVIRATGWHSLPTSTSEMGDQTPIGKWHGLGRSGVLEDACDASGSCSQDGQNFKGIFFHHLTRFCEPFPPYSSLPEGFFAGMGVDDGRKSHEASCSRYTTWIRHNSKAALATRDRDGKIGMWWGAPKGVDVDKFHYKVQLPKGIVDHRNPPLNSREAESQTDTYDEMDDNKYVKPHGQRFSGRDLNDRGRGRTVETHAGGVAVLRAAWENSQNDQYLW